MGNPPGISKRAGELGLAVLLGGVRHSGKA
jgi:hypothetical protein